MEKKRSPQFKSAKDVPAGFSGKATINGVEHVFSGKSMRAKSPAQAAERKRLHEENDRLNRGGIKARQAASKKRK